MLRSPHVLLMAPTGTSLGNHDRGRRGVPIRVHSEYAYCFESWLDQESQRSCEACVGLVTDNPFHLIDTRPASGSSLPALSASSRPEPCARCWNRRACGNPAARAPFTTSPTCSVGWTQSPRPVGPGARSSATVGPARMQLGQRRILRRHLGSDSSWCWRWPGGWCVDRAQHGAAAPHSSRRTRARRDGGGKATEDAPYGRMRRVRPSRSKGLVSPFLPPLCWGPGAAS
jgi:hypothetical protein